MARQKSNRRRRRRTPEAIGQPAPSAPARPAVLRSRAWVALALTVATIVAYSPALKAPLQFDDIASIPDNITIRRLWPPSVPLHPPSGSAAVSGRPVVNYTLALNYALNKRLGIDQRPESASQYRTVGYHTLNVLLHLVCGALLFGLLRRTLRLDRLGAPWSAVADQLAAVITSIWLLHPIQTEAVNYVVQRTELIVSACYLGTLYASTRAWDAKGLVQILGWYAVAVGVCLLGMGSKEVMITAPLAVLLYDRAFHFTSWKQTIRAANGRPWFFLALAATSAWSIALIVAGPRSATVGFNVGIPWYQYAYSQAWAILRYLRLVVWPDDLLIDYGQDPIGGFRGVPGVILLSAFGLATAVAWIRPNKWGWFGFLGAWFFLLLAPSSSVVPIGTEIAAERRVYLALAAILVLLVIGLEALRRRTAPASRLRQPALVRALVIGVGLVLTGATFRRSLAYAHPHELWRPVVAASPTSARAWNGLGYALLLEDPPRLDEAQTQLRNAIDLDSTYLPALRTLAVIAIKQHRLEDGKAILERELHVDPEYADGAERMGEVLSSLGMPDRAIPFLQRAAAKGQSAAPFAALGSAYMATGRPEDAIEPFRRALAFDSASTDAMRYLGHALVERGRGVEALLYLENARARDPESGFGLALLSLAYAQTGRLQDAAVAADDAVGRAGGEAIVYLLSGQAMVLAKRSAEAEKYYEQVIAISPGDPAATTTLGEIKAAAGKRDEAVELFRRALKTAPDYGPARHALRQLERPTSPRPARVTP